MAVINRATWKYVRGLALPLLVLAGLIGWLVYLLYARAHWWQQTDQNNLREWINEARPHRQTLPELAREYLDSDNPDPSTKAEEIEEQLKALVMPTRVYGGQLPLFPEIYRLEVRFPEDRHLPQATIAWGNDKPQSSIGQRLEYNLLGDQDPSVKLHLEYQLHAYNQRQREQEQRQTLLQAVTGLAGAAALLVAAWVYFFLKRERAREVQRLLAHRQIEHAEKLLLENELRRQEAERQQEETERKLLEQRLATQAAEGKALELKSQLYASISIMAGSYAHNIKNLLVRPNDLLSRCLEADGLPHNQQHMLSEVRQTLGTVTERLQQILRTVRRDPTRSEMTRIDLNFVAKDILETWEELAREKWKLTLSGDFWPEPLWIEGDISHLQQAAENLVFNARDATFEMRNQLRDQARRTGGLESQQRRQALIDAAAWRGATMLRTRRQDGRAILEVQDNGVGMTDEVRHRCTETHFSTKRDNAIYEGISTGMGLGLSFVVVILEHHQAAMTIESKPLAGTLFRVSFPLVEPASVTVS